MQKRNGDFEEVEYLFPSPSPSFNLDLATEFKVIIMAYIYVKVAHRIGSKEISLRQLFCLSSLSGRMLAGRENLEVKTLGICRDVMLEYTVVFNFPT